MKTKIFFLTVLIAGLLASCQNNVNTNAKLMPEPNYTTPPFIIDSHMHYRATDEWEKAFVETYTKHHAMACLLMGMKDLERGIAFAKAHPDLVIPYAAVDIESPTAVEDAQKAYDMGYKGLGELFASGNYDYCDPKYEPLWTLAEKLGLPIAPHTGNLANGLMHHLRPAALADICARHPKLLIHAAHFGNPWYEEAAECARRNVNLYFDLSGSSLIKKEKDPWFWDQWLWWTDAIGKAHMPKNAVPAWEKIVFATDEGPDQLVENIRRFNKVMDACKVDEATRAKCYGLTIAKMHGIKVPESQVKSIDHMAIK
jgi:predicted TIM-barrel fold metal-dependent hydrolase